MYIILTKDNKKSKRSFIESDNNSDFFLQYIRLYFEIYYTSTYHSSPFVVKNRRSKEEWISHLNIFDVY